MHPHLCTLDALKRVSMPTTCSIDRSSLYMRSRYELASSSISVAPTSEAPGPSAAAAEAHDAEMPTRAARVGEEMTASEKRRLRASGADGGAEGEETKAGRAWEGGRWKEKERGAGARVQEERGGRGGEN